MRNYLPDSKDNFNVHSSSISKGIGLLWAPMDLSVQMDTRDVDTRTPCSCYFASSLPFYGLLPACFQLSGITLRYTLWYTSLPCVSVSCVCPRPNQWTLNNFWHVDGMGWSGAFYEHVCILHSRSEKDSGGKLKQTQCMNYIKSQQWWELSR